jgi:hypothetical protein
MVEPKLSIIIVSYNTCQLTIACLTSIFAETCSPFEVVVVDNNSKDGSAQAIAAQFPQVRIIALDTNIGFASANNLAAKVIMGEYLLLLNSDTLVLDRALDKSLIYLNKHPNIGALGIRTVYEDRTLNPTSCFDQPSLWGALCSASGLSSLLPTFTLFNSESIGGWERDTVRDVGAITGCFMMMKRSLWQHLGGFDENYFMYSEDTDLSRRILDRGLRCVHYPGASIIHYGGRSDAVPAEKMAKVLSARARFIRKHWSPFRAVLGVWLINVQVYSRLVASRLLNLFGLGMTSREKWKDVWARRPMWRCRQQIYPYQGPPTRPNNIVAGSSIIGRLRLAMRWALYLPRFAKSGDWDFVTNALKGLWLLMRLSIGDISGRKSLVECNLCGWVGQRFYPNTGPGYFELDTLCPGCRGLDRHRSLLAVLTAKTNMFSAANRVVEVAPMRGFEAACLAQPCMNYTSFDLARRAMEQGDITSMRFESGTVDYFICFHVLEHIPDVDKAISEIRRVLRVGGVAVLQVPIFWGLDKSYEYEKPNPREVGHVRAYGVDFPEIISSHGFHIEPLCAGEIFSDDVVRRFGLSLDPIYLACKTDS